MINKDDKGSYAIGGCLLIGIGTGLFLMNTNPLAMPASTLIGLGVGLLISSIMSRKNKDTAKTESSE